MLWHVTQGVSYAQPTTVLTSTEQAQWRHVLDKFPSIFKDPTELPPSHVSDHRIQLKPGVQSISVRPYRYGNVQKDEIERLVAETLTAGIIKPSSSPFSNQVLLVKKKGW